MSTLDELVTELERSYTETQERLSDPAVYNDRREAAETGRRLKALERPYSLAQEWRRRAPISTPRAATATSPSSCQTSSRTSRGWKRS